VSSGAKIYTKSGEKGWRRGGKAQGQKREGDEAVEGGEKRSKWEQTKGVKEQAIYPHLRERSGHSCDLKKGHSSSEKGREEKRGKKPKRGV